MDDARNPKIIIDLEIISGVTLMEANKCNSPIIGYLGIISKLLKIAFSIQVHRMVLNELYVVSEYGKSPATMVPGLTSKG